MIAVLSLPKLCLLRNVLLRAGPVAGQICNLHSPDLVARLLLGPAWRLSREAALETASCREQTPGEVLN